MWSQLPCALNRPGFAVQLRSLGECRCCGPSGLASAGDLIQRLIGSGEDSDFPFDFCEQILGCVSKPGDLTLPHDVKGGCTVVVSMFFCSLFETGASIKRADPPIDPPECTSRWRVEVAGHVTGHVEHRPCNGTCVPSTATPALCHAAAGAGHWVYTLYLAVWHQPHTSVPRDRAFVRPSALWVVCGCTLWGCSPDDGLNPVLFESVCVECCSLQPLRKYCASNVPLQQIAIVLQAVKDDINHFRATAPGRRPPVQGHCAGKQPPVTATARQRSDVGRKGWDELIAALEETRESFLRSLLLFYFLATAHLYLRAVPLLSRHKARNVSLRTARRMLGGAPHLWALAFLLCWLPRAQAMRRAVGNSNRRDMSVEAAGMADRASHHGTSQHAIHPNQRCSPLSEGLGFRISSVVLRYQRSHAFNLQWWDPGITSALWCAMVRDDCFLADEPVQVFAASPQPPFDRVVLGAMPRWLLDSMAVPVFISVCGSQEPCFIEIFTGSVSHKDVRISVGDLWPAGGDIYVGYNTVPLPEDVTFTPSVGLLIRVCRPGRGKLRMRSLDVKLDGPEGLRRLSYDEAPAPLAMTPGILLLKPGAERGYIRVPQHATTTFVRDAISEAFGLRPGDFVVHAPCVPISDLMSEGRCVGSALGILPSCLHACRAAFVDPRALGRPVALLALPPVPFTISGVLNLISAHRPAHLSFSVRGAPRIEDQAEAFLPQDGMLISLYVDPYMQPPTVEDSRLRTGRSSGPTLGPTTGSDWLSPFPRHLSSSADDDLLSQDSDQYVGGLGHPPTQYHTYFDPVRLGRGLHGPPSAEANDFHTLVVPAPTLAEVGMWNWRTRPDALAQCISGDTPAATTTSDPSHSAALWLCRDEPLPATCSDLTRDIVERADSGLLRVVRQEDVYGHLEAAEEESAASDQVVEEQEESSPADGPRQDDTWRLPVRVLNYQRMQVYDNLLVSPHEELVEVIARAEVFFKPQGDFFDLVAPLHQPSGDCLTLMCFPRWWRHHGIRAFIIADGDRPRDPFIELIRPGDTLGDVLPLRGQPSAGTVDTFLAGDPDPDEASDQNLPGQEGLLFVQRGGLPTPSFATADEILADRSLDTPDDRTPVSEGAPGTRYLLLGSGFDQTVLDVGPGPLSPQVAEAAGIPQEFVTCWVQQGLFEVAAVQGRPIHRAIGVRDGRITRPCPCAVFIDARTLGRPLCCRALPSSEVSVDYLLQSIEVQLPPELKPEIVGGDIVWGQPELRRFRHCSTIILWARSAEDSDSSGASGEPGSSLPGNEEDGFGDEHEADPTGRDSPSHDRTRPGPADRSRSPAGGRLPTSSDVAYRCAQDKVATVKGRPPLCSFRARTVATPCRGRSPHSKLCVERAFGESPCTLLELADKRFDLSAVISVYKSSDHTAAPCGDVSPDVAVPLRVGSLACPFNLADIRSLLCVPAKLESLHQALGVLSLSDRAWFLQRADAMRMTHRICCVTLMGPFCPQPEIPHRLLAGPVPSSNQTLRARLHLKPVWGSSADPCRPGWAQHKFPLLIWQNVLRWHLELGRLLETFLIAPLSFCPTAWQH